MRGAYYFGLVFPLIVPAVGVITAIIGIYLTKPRPGEGGLTTINRAFYISAVISAVLCGIAAFAYLPSSFAGLEVEGLQFAGPMMITQLPFTFFPVIILFSIILFFILWGVWKRTNVYDAFIEGAKEGFTTAVRIIPYLVAFLVGIAVFRASGAMDLLVEGIGAVVGWFGVDTSFVGALPTALMKSLSGSGANGLMIDAMNQYGADSFVGRMSCVVRGASDTTFYILAVYFGSVGVTRTRNAVTCGLLADLSGIVAGIIISYWFF